MGLLEVSMQVEVRTELNQGPILTHQALVRHDSVSSMSSPSSEAQSWSSTLRSVRVDDSDAGGVDIVLAFIGLEHGHQPY